MLFVSETSNNRTHNCLKLSNFRLHCEINCLYTTRVVHCHYHYCHHHCYHCYQHYSKHRSVPGLASSLESSSMSSGESFKALHLFLDWAISVVMSAFGLILDWVWTFIQLLWGFLPNFRFLKYLWLVFAV